MFCTRLYAKEATSARASRVSARDEDGAEGSDALVVEGRHDDVRVDGKGLAVESDGLGGEGASEAGDREKEQARGDGRGDGGAVERLISSLRVIQETETNVSAAGGTSVMVCKVSTTEGARGGEATGKGRTG